MFLLSMPHAYQILSNIMLEHSEVISPILLIDEGSNWSEGASISIFNELHFCINNDPTSFLMASKVDFYFPFTRVAEMYSFIVPGISRR